MEILAGEKFGELDYLPSTFSGLLPLTCSSLKQDFTDTGGTACTGFSGINAGKPNQ